MANVTSFEAALEATEGQDRALLIGNGFSVGYFSYANLLAEADLDQESPIRRLFDELGTVDFEAVVLALENAAVVERACANDAHSSELVSHAQEVREALVRAVNKTHPKHKEDLAEDLKSAAKFINSFKVVFSVNYDLLLYWLNLDYGHLNDGFGLGEEVDRGQFRGPFSENAYCSIYNLHGGLHLFRGASGETYKALNKGDGVIKTITDTILRGRLPMYVAEATSEAKMGKINSSPYLRFCYDELKRNAANMFVYGHSAADNDSHIYRAIFSSETEHVYFGVYEQSEEELIELDAQMAKYRKLGGEEIAYTFFDSRSASVWDAKT